MSTTCPKGHESEWPDWCSVCGERLEGAGAATPAATTTNEMPTPDPVAGAPTAAGPTCSNCGVSAHPDDVFCESCGYDFASGTLPVAVESLPPSSPAPDAGAAPPDPGDRTSLIVTVSIDAAFFAATTADVELTLPDPPPDPAPITLAGSRNLVGRHSASRGILPEIDIEALTSDPGVSSRHLMLERAGADAWTLTDLGSTNGTYLSAEAAADPITPGTALPVADAMSLWLGAWTRLDFAIKTNAT